MSLLLGLSDSSVQVAAVPPALLAPHTGLPHTGDRQRSVVALAQVSVMIRM